MNTPLSNTGFPRAVARRARRALVRTLDQVRTLGASIHPRPLLILGNQKSGTTAIAALLSELTGIPCTLDLRREMVDPTIDRVRSGAMSFDAFVRRNKLDFSRPMIKEPSLTLFYTELADYFPHSPFLMVIRDPRDNIRSILNRMALPGDLDDLHDTHRAGMTRAWRLIMDTRWLGIGGGNYVEMLAQRWNYMVELYDRHAGRTVLVQYEDFLTDKAGTIGRLASELGLPHRHSIADKVDVQFQPAGKRDVRWLDFFGEHNLRAIERICADRMKLLHYRPSV